jgi:hypothetical protein
LFLLTICGRELALDNSKSLDVDAMRPKPAGCLRERVHASSGSRGRTPAPLENAANTRVAPQLPPGQESSFEDPPAEWLAQDRDNALKKRLRDHTHRRLPALSKNRTRPERRQTEPRLPPGQRQKSRPNLQAKMSSGNRL